MLINFLDIKEWFFGDSEVKTKLYFASGFIIFCDVFSNYFYIVRRLKMVLYYIATHAMTCWIGFRVPTSASPKIETASILLLSNLLYFGRLFRNAGPGIP